MFHCIPSGSLNCAVHSLPCSHHGFRRALTIPEISRQCILVNRCKLVLHWLMTRLSYQASLYSQKLRKRKAIVWEWQTNTQVCFSQILLKHTAQASSHHYYKIHLPQEKKKSIFLITKKRNKLSTSGLKSRTNPTAVPTEAASSPCLFHPFACQWGAFTYGKSHRWFIGMILWVKREHDLME